MIEQLIRHRLDSLGIVFANIPDGQYFGHALRRVHLGGDGALRLNEGKIDLRWRANNPKERKTRLATWWLA